MVLSTTTPSRLQLQPSNIRMRYAIPMEYLGGYEIRITTTLIFGLNVICTLVNYVAQNTILILKLQRSVDEYHSNLDWVTFAAALVSCIGTVASLIMDKNRPPHKGRLFNFFVSLMLVASIGHDLAVHNDPSVVACMFSHLLLYITKANSKYKERWYLLGDMRVPIAGICIQGEAITAVAVSEDDGYLVHSLSQGGREVALLVYSGEALMADINMREE